MEAGSASRARGLVVILGWLGVWAALWFLPLPGVDQEVAGQPELDGHRLQPSLLPFQVFPLVLCRGALAVAIALKPDRAAVYTRRVLFGYVGASAALAFIFAVALEGVGVGMGMLVPDPGWGFRLLVTVTLVGSASLQWLAVSRMTATGLLHGTLLIYLLYSSAQLFFAVGEAGWELGFHASPDFSLFYAPLVAVPMALGLCVLGWRRLKWPIPIMPGFELRSPLDALALLLLATEAIIFGPELLLAADAFMLEPGWVLHDGSGGLVYGAWALTATMLVLLSLVLWRPPVVEGGSGRSKALFAAAIMVPLFYGTTFAVFWRDAGGDARDLLDRSPFAGATHEMVLVSSEGFGAQDLPVFEERLRRLDVRVQSSQVAPDRLVLQLSGPGDLEERARKVVEPKSFGAHLPVQAPPPLPQGAPSGIERSRTEAWARASDHAAAAALLDLGPPEHDQHLAAECSSHRACQIWLLEPPQIEGKDVEEAAIRYNDFTHMPEVRARLTPGAADRFTRLTTENVQGQLVLTLDDQVLSAPRIMEPIGGGEMFISIPYMDGGSAELEAKALEVLSTLTGETQAKWTLEVVRPLP